MQLTGARCDCKVYLAGFEGSQDFESCFRSDRPVKLALSSSERRL